MFLYNLTLQRSSAITCTALGSFIHPKGAEMAVGRGRTIELFAVSSEGKLTSEFAQDIFGVVRSLTAFRLPGTTRDYLIVGSDSGKITVLEFSTEQRKLVVVHSETYGKTGCRRIVPGEMLAADPKGRAVMIAAVEKQKLVYVFNRDQAAKLTISSPLEAHRSFTVNLSVVGVDVGFNNPIFAILEMDYTEADSDHTGQAQQVTNKSLTYYELDLGLNHVVRKWSDAVDPSANMLVAVPGDENFPGGVLVCCENKIAYKKPDHEEIVQLIPRRHGMPIEQPLLITSCCCFKKKDLFFFLLQSEFGDLYRLDLKYDGETVSAVDICYFDTVQVAASICVLKTGHLFVASEMGNHALYQILDINVADDETIIPVTIEQEGITIEVPHFVPRSLKYIVLVEEADNMCPIIDMKVMDLLGEDSPQIYTLCGRGPRSTMRVLRHGLTVAEMALSQLPGNPNAVWTIKHSRSNPIDKYIVVSFVNATLVLSIGETVEEVTDSGLLANAPTLSCCLLGEDAILQVYPNGIRHIRADRRLHEWKPPNKTTIIKSAVNNRQCAVALNNGDVIYFELDASGQLVEVEKMTLGADAACLDIGPIPEGRQRCRYLAVGVFEGVWIVRMVSLDPEDRMTSLSRQALPAQPESLALESMQTRAGQGVGAQDLFLHVGLVNGVMLRILVDPSNGNLSADYRTRLLGSRPVRLVKLPIRNSAAVLALSSRSWLGYNHLSHYTTTPLTYDALEHASSFCSEQCPEGIVAVTGDTLRIIGVERLGEMFNQTIIPLKYTPRRLLVHPTTGFMVILESDHNERSRPQCVPPTSEMTDQSGPDPLLAVSRAGAGQWASCIRVVEPLQLGTVELVELDNNEAAVCMTTATFPDRLGQEQLLVVGTGIDMKLNPRSASSGALHLYRVTEGRLQLLQKTPIADGPPTALCGFQGKLLVGVGKALRIYELGKKKFLKKSENRSLPNLITSILTYGGRIYVSDVAESFHMLKYKKSENALYVFADDTYPRWVTCQSLLDYDSLAGGDKFGNIFVARLPQDVSEDVDDDPSGTKLKWDSAVLNGAPHKMEEIIQFHVGETITGIQRCALQPGGAEAICYATVFGTIGALIPFTSREDVDFFTHLEMHLRQEAAPLCGRDHLSFRSAYYPVKEVIDGDLCEQYSLLSYQQARAIAEELDRSPAEIAKKLEDIRNKLL